MPQRLPPGVTPRFLQLNLDEETMAGLVRTARRDERSVAAHARWIIRQYLAREQEGDN